MTAGIFEATTGTFEIHFPYTEHATVVYVTRIALVILLLSSKDKL